MVNCALKKKYWKPIFIVFEGPHASGKSYFAKRLARQMSSSAMKLVYTKEPFNKKLRPIVEILSTKKHNDPFALFYVIAADRMLHLREVEKLLSSGISVISDRYTYSTEVYQRIQGVPLELINHVNDFAKQPDLIFYADTPFEVRKHRILKRGKNKKHLFYQDQLLTLEDKYYSKIKRKLSRKSNAIILNGISEDEVSRMKEIVVKKIRQKTQ